MVQTPPFLDFLNGRISKSWFIGNILIKNLKLYYMNPPPGLGDDDESIGPPPGIDIPQK